jgi:hypothetical protein
MRYDPQAGNKDAYTALLKVSFLLLTRRKDRDLSDAKSVSYFPVSPGTFIHVQSVDPHNVKLTPRIYNLT